MTLLGTVIRRSRNALDTVVSFGTAATTVPDLLANPTFYCLLVGAGLISDAARYRSEQRSEKEHEELNDACLNPDGPASPVVLDLFDQQQQQKLIEAANRGRVASASRASTIGSSSPL